MNQCGFVEGCQRTDQHLHCAVPFCNHTTKADRKMGVWVEWVCGKHWRMVPRQMRRILTRLRKMQARSRDQFELQRRQQRIWRRCRRAAVERAAGL